MDFANMDLKEFEELFKQFNKFPFVMKLDMIELKAISWDSMKMQRLTCVNHPWARYLTKNPWSRNLHFIQGPYGLDSLLESEECTCPFTDLRVVISEMEK
jgi:hypothetical protein